jgi:hypothetical protein
LIALGTSRALNDEKRKELQKAGLIDYSEGTRLEYSETYVNVMKLYARLQPDSFLRLAQFGATG